MKIAFINSSLEPERDGVGDYTRLLAQECVRQGQECRIVALHDRHTPSVLQTDEGGDVKGLRLPSTLSWAERTTAARVALAEFAPDWASVQFVPYGFHDKGLAWEAARHLLTLLKGYKTHVMLHELWVGEAHGSPVQHRLYGAAQKRIMLQMLRRLRPRVVHTSNCTYVNILQHYGVHAERLPLFGNIPVTDNTADDWLFAQLQDKGVDIMPANRDRFWLLGFFGSLPPEWPPEPLFGQVRQAAREQGKQVVILSAGGVGAAGEALWRAMETNYASEFTFHALGRLPAPQVSEYLNTLDFGLAAAPVSLLGKSGAVAAMRDHGLPVIANRDNLHFTHFSSTEEKDVPTNNALSLLSENRTGLPRQPPNLGLKSTTQRFLHEILS